MYLLQNGCMGKRFIVQAIIKIQNGLSAGGQQLRQWERESIRFLLTNDAYIGNLVQSGKHMKEQITAEHTHEPLVSEEVFIGYGKE